VILAFGFAKMSCRIPDDGGARCVAGGSAMDELAQTKDDEGLPGKPFRQQSLPMSPIETPEAEALSDLTLIALDLLAVMHISDRLIEELKKKQQGNILPEALWAALVIKYVRCFGWGVRSGLNESVFDGLESNVVEAYRHFKLMRDRHIAHSVNPFEEASVGVLLSLDRTSVQGIGVASRKLISSSVSGVESLKQLASIAHDVVCKRAKRAQNELLEWAKKQPIGTFKVGPVGFVTPGPSQANKAR